jgi:hypothetical protein
MGQYYRPISIDKNEFVLSFDYGNGLKIMEHSWIGNNFVTAVENLIKRGGKWYGTRIVWAGDYADKEPNKDKNLYRLVVDKVTPTKVEYSKKLRFLKNIDTGEYVDLNKVPEYEWKDYYIHPLPLLTVEGMGQGGGDFFIGDNIFGDYTLIGKWARQRITIQTKRPKSRNSKEIFFNLTAPKR